MYTWELDPTDPTSMLRSLCFMLVEQQLKTMAINPRCEVMKVWSQRRTQGGGGGTFATP